MSLASRRIASLVGRRHSDSSLRGLLTVRRFRAATALAVLVVVVGAAGAPVALAGPVPVPVPNVTGVVGGSSDYAPAPEHTPDTAAFFRQIARVNTSGVDWSTVPMTPSTAIQRGGLAPALVTLGNEIMAGKSVVLPADIGTQPGQSVSGMQGKTIWYGYLQAQHYETNGSRTIGVCWLDLYDSTPSPALGVRHGFAISCSQPWVVAYTGDPDHQGGIFSGLGQITNTAGQLQTPYGLSGGPVSDVDYYPWYAYKPYASETGFTRWGDLQTEDQYGYIYLTVNSGWFDGAEGAGHSASLDCQKSGAMIWCQVISNPFAFIPNDNYNCITGSICDTINNAPGTASASPTPYDDEPADLPTQEDLQNAIDDVAPDASGPDTDTDTFRPDGVTTFNPGPYQPLSASVAGTARQVQLEAVGCSLMVGGKDHPAADKVSAAGAISCSSVGKVYDISFTYLDSGDNTLAFHTKHSVNIKNVRSATIISDHMNTSRPKRVYRIKFCAAFKPGGYSGAGYGCAYATRDAAV